MTQTKSRYARYRQQLKRRVAKLHGKKHGVCVLCDNVATLELAYIAETPVFGRGRGLDRRYRDALKHPWAYIRICRACHLRIDNG